MDWNAVGAVGEIVGAIAVVASLLYLAKQVRQHGSEVRSAASDAAIHSLVNWLNPLFANRDTWDIFWRGTMDLTSLKEDDLPLYVELAFTWLKTVEGLHLKHEMGVLDLGVWEGWSRVLHSFNQSPGLRAYFDARQPAFSSTFRIWMDEAVVEDADLPSMRDLVRRLASEGSARETDSLRLSDNRDV